MLRLERGGELFDRVDTETRHAYRARTKPRNHSLYRRYGKRLFDLSLSLVLLLFVVPIIAVLALMVALQGGSPFFSQPRVGRYGQTFRCFKLRTMVKDADEKLKALCESDEAIAREWAETQKLRNDPRTTALGRFLRKSSLDELPQIVNVLKGDMSLVGPRPFMLDQRELYDSVGDRAYYDLRPGITGLWQVTERGQSDFITRVHHDEAYSEKMSLLLDLKLIIATIHVVLRRTGH
jgi:lipopolysaccharide/colanic/teichoic acid biosynthesis glycosyltransferase